MSDAALSKMTPKRPAEAQFELSVVFKSVYFVLIHQVPLPSCQLLHLLPWRLPWRLALDRISQGHTIEL